MAMVIAQNGPGITNFVTAIKTAYWNHTPMLLVTPQAANRTIGQGGFQEVEQMALFRDMVGYQEEVRDPARIAEVLNRVILKARRLSAPAQINVPRDYWTQVIDIDLPAMVEFERPSGGAEAIAEAARLLSEARFPVILNGAGVVLADAIPASKALAERLDAPVACNYQHNDAFPGSHPLSVGPLGYNGSRAAMELIARADVVLALGTRLNPFSTLPGYGIDYWPKSAKLIQVDLNPDRIGLTKPVAVGIVGDAGAVATSHPRESRRQRRRRRPHRAPRSGRGDQIPLAPGARLDGPRGRRPRHLLERRRPRPRAGAGCRPRMAWRAIQSGLPQDAIISSDIGNNCAIGNAYPTFEAGRKYLAPGLFGPCGYGFPAIVGAKIGCPDVSVVGFAGDGAFGISMSEMSAIGRTEWPAITMVIFRNYQWGAEKRNTTLWYDNNFVGTELDPDLSYARVAEACGLNGIAVRTMDELTRTLREACAAQARGRHHLHRGHPQPGTRRALPPRRDEEAGRRRRHRPRRHGALAAGAVSGWILALNAGSSSLKYAAFDADGETRRADGILRDIDVATLPESALIDALAGLARKAGLTGPPAAIGHRVVHGLDQRAPAEITPAIHDLIARAAVFAPLHNPPALRVIDLARSGYPAARQVACFDTAFHATNPPEAVTFAHSGGPARRRPAPLRLPRPLLRRPRAPLR